MLCLTCRRLSPPGARYCSYCPEGKSFNGIICAYGHRSCRGTLVCPTCRNSEFSEATWGVPTGWIAKVVTVGLLIMIWKIGLAHSSGVFSALGVGLSWSFGFLTNTNSGMLPALLRGAVAWGILAWLVGLWLSVMPGQGGALGRFLRGLPVRTFQHLLRASIYLIKGLGQTTLALSGLRAQKPAPHATRSQSYSHRAGHADHDE